MTIDTGKVQAHLNEVLQSEVFVKNEKLSAFLEFVVQERLAGREDSLKQYTIAVRALGYQVDFSPQINPVVRIYASRLRRSLNEYYESVGTGTLRIVLPKGSYVPEFHVPDKANTTEAYQIPPVLQSAPSLEESPTELSIAILPFTFLSNSEDVTYLSVGVTQELVIGLTYYQSLTVIGPVPEHDAQMNVQEIGNKYGVRFVLAGTIRQIETNIRISVTLSDTRRGKKVWANNYKYDLGSTNIFDIEQEISEQIAAMIGGGFGVMARSLYGEARQKDLQRVTAMDGILRYHYFHVVTSKDALAEAIVALERALEKEPNNALLLATLADSYWMSAIYSFKLAKNEMQRSRELVDRALIIQPDSQMAHIVLASHYALQNDIDATYSEIEKALEGNPRNPLILVFSGMLMIYKGNWEGLELIEDAMRLNPSYPAYYHEMFCYHYIRVEDYEAAIISADKLSFPEDTRQPMLRAAILGHLGRVEDAQDAMDEVVQRRPEAAEDPTKLVRRMAPTPDVADNMILGLVKAGLVNEATISAR